MRKAETETGHRDTRFISGVSSAVDRAAQDAERALPVIAMIDRRILIRECMAHFLAGHISASMTPFDDIESFDREKERLNPALVIIAVGAGELGMAASERIRSVCDPAPVLMLGSGGIDAVLRQVRLGVRGHITSETPLLVVVEAIDIVMRGGVFIADEYFTRTPLPCEAAAPDESIPLTVRERQVLALVREAKANKVIAHELQMSESTVKVHIHNIMRKLNARNRTDVVLKSANGQASVAAAHQPERVLNGLE